MGWKSVELQVALPRTQDAGKQQDLLSKQGQRFQESISQAQAQQDIQKRKQVQKFEKTDKSKIDDKTEGNHSKDGSFEGENKNEKDIEDRMAKIKHPYLGCYFDTNG